MALDFLRGLFGSSGRQYVNSRPNDFRVEAERGSVADRQLGDGTMMKRMPTLTPDLETPKQDRARKWALVGATLQDVGMGLRGGQGGSLEGVQEGWRRQQARERAEKQEAELRDLALSLYGDDDESRLLFETHPEAFAAAMIKDRTPQYIEGPGGIYEVTGGESRLVQKYEPEPEKLNFGWTRDPQTGRLRPELDGPADPGYIARTAGVRRDAVVSRPMPRQGGGGRGTGAGGGAPWKQRWTP